jgi:serine/threonine protein kinase
MNDDRERCATCGTAVNALGCCPRCAISVLQTDGIPEEWSRWFPHFTSPLKVGSGAMGDVYEAMDASSGEVLAVKLPNKDYYGDAEFLRLMRDEGQTLRMLDHPGIVKLRTYGDIENGPPFLVMDFVDGGNLQFLLVDGPLKRGLALDIAGQIADALAYAHGRGCVHRDIKPSNVMVTRDREVKLTDFGVARWFASDEDRTQWAKGAGTAYYIAPEILNRKEAGGPPADVFSLGVLLHYMLTKSFLAGWDSKPSKLLGRPLSSLIRQMTREDPRQRPSAEEVTVRIRAMRNTGEAPARPVKRWMAGTVAVLVVFMVLWKSAPARNAVAPAPQTITPTLSTESWTNSLGMEFIPIAGTSVWFSRYETRIADWRAFAEMDEDERWDWQSSDLGYSLADDETEFLTWTKDGWISMGHSVLAPGYEVTDDTAVAGVLWSEAKAFCQWLTWREQQRDATFKNGAYRLPTDREWSIAAGLEDETGDSPESRNLSHRENPFPWGASWPPPRGWGNYAAGESADALWGWHKRSARLEYRDPFCYAGIVGRFGRSGSGLLDLSGNVAEWCGDEWGNKGEHVLRGGSWLDGTEERLRLDYRNRRDDESRMPTSGFRAVLVKG